MFLFGGANFAFVFFFFFWGQKNWEKFDYICQNLGKFCQNFYITKFKFYITRLLQVLFKI